jgi:putative transposase
VKTTPVGGERGFDGYKKINGRKRFLLVDTLGLLLLVKIAPANMAETKAAMAGLEKVNEVFSMVMLAWADQGFGGEPFSTWLMKEVGWKLELASGISTPGKPDFEVTPRRWVVEAIPPVTCILGSRENNCLVVGGSAGWVYAAMTLLMVRRLARMS